MSAVRPFPSPDRRRSERRVIQGAVTVTTQSGQLFEAIAIDISQHGLAAIVMGEIHMDETVQLTFLDPDDEHRLVVRDAIVRAWDGRHGGFEFLLTMHAAK
jgi:hypothetical protein